MCYLRLEKHTFVVFNKASITGNIHSFYCQINRIIPSQIFFSTPRKSSQKPSKTFKISLRPTRGNKKKKKKNRINEQPNRQTEISKLVDVTSRKGKQVACTGRVITGRITGDHKLYLVALTNNDSRPILHPIFIDSVDASISVIIVSLHLSSSLSLSFLPLFLAILIYLSLPRVVDKSPLHSSIQSVERTSRFFFFHSLSLSLFNLIYPFLFLGELQAGSPRFILQIRALDNPADGF